MKVVVKTIFRDKYTRKVYKLDDEIDVTDKRYEEIKQYVEKIEDKIGMATFYYYKFKGDSTTNEEYPFIFEKTTSFSDYTPKNNKCFVYPYNYLYITNNMRK